MKVTKRMLTVLLAGVFVMLVGCGPGLQIVAGRQEIFQGGDQLVLEKPREDILDVIAEVGKSFGYSVRLLDKGRGNVGLYTQSGVISALTLGKDTSANIAFMRNPKDETKFQVQYTLQANWGLATQERAEAHWNEFKSKLLEKLNE